MMNCKGCQALESSAQQLVACDRCSSRWCQECAQLTATELRSVVLKKRTIIFLCRECRPDVDLQGLSGIGDPNRIDLVAEISSLMRTLISDVRSDVEAKFDRLRMDIAVLRNSNCDLISLLTGSKAMSVGNKKPSSALLKTLDNPIGDTTAVYSDMGQRKEDNVVNARVDRNVDVYTSGSKRTTADLNVNIDRRNGSGRKNRSAEAMSQNMNPRKVAAAVHEAATRAKCQEVITLGETEREAPNEWKIVSKRRKTRNRNMPVVGEIEHTVSSTLRAAPRKAHFHVYRLAPETTEENVIQHLKVKFPEVECQGLKSRYPDQYASFKVTVRSEFAQEIIKPSCWPRGACINKFFQRKAPVKEVG